MTHPDTADVCIVGLGATGSIAAWELARRGLHVVALEAGPVWEVEDFVPDELDSDAFANRLGTLWNETPVGWFDPSTGRESTAGGLNMMNGIGGSAVHYAGHAWRFHPSDFRTASVVAERYGRAALPERSTVVDWPFDYDALEPFYGEIEQAIGICGQAGVLLEDGRPVEQAGGNPFEGARVDPYPMPPLAVHRLGQLVAAGARSLGLHPFMGAIAINSVPYRGRNASNRCGFCLGFGCRVQAKGSPNNTVLPDALGTGNLDIVPEARVTRLESDGGRTVSQVHFRVGDEQSTLRAKVVLVAGYTFETFRVLAASATAAHPNGLGGNSGQLGRHFMSHRYDAVGAHFPGQQLNRFAGPQGQRMVIDDYNADNFDHAGLGFIQGAQIFAPNEWHPIQDTPVVPPSWPSWGREYKRLLRAEWNSIGRIMTNVEVLPYEDNRLELDPRRIDAAGIPMVRAVYSMHENEHRLVEFVTDRMVEIAKAAGAAETWRLNSVVIPSQHDSGGVRMGDDPTTSVVDGYGRLHDVRNVFALGPATLPTSSSANPSVTIQAMALRTARHVLDTW